MREEGRKGYGVYCRATRLCSGYLAALVRENAGFVDMLRAAPPDLFRQRLQLWSIIAADHSLFDMLCAREAIRSCQRFIPVSGAIGRVA